MKWDRSSNVGSTGISATICRLDRTGADNPEHSEAERLSASRSHPGASGMDLSAYIRCSTEDQRDSPEVQRATIPDWCRREGHTIVAEDADEA